MSLTFFQSNNGEKQPQELEMAGSSNVEDGSDGHGASNG